MLQSPARVSAREPIGPLVGETARLNGRAANSSPARGLVVFELDGTLLRGPTVDQLLSAQLGFPERAAPVLGRELAVQRVTRARRLLALPPPRRTAALSRAMFAPQAEETIALLRRRSIECAIVSLSWDFAVEWAGLRLGIEYTLGTGLSSNGAVVHVWPDDLADFPARLAGQLGVPMSRTALVSRPAHGLLQAAKELALRWA